MSNSITGFLLSVMYLHNCLIHVHASCSHDGLSNPYSCIGWMMSRIGYLKLLITRSILAGPLDFEIKRVACTFLFFGQSIYLLLLQHPLARITCRIIARREDKRRWIDENVKCESEMKTRWKLKEVRFKNRLKTGMLCLWHLVVKRPNCCTEMSQCRQQCQWVICSTAQQLMGRTNTYKSLLMYEFAIMWGGGCDVSSWLAAGNIEVEVLQWWSISIYQWQILRAKHKLYIWENIYT